MICDFFTSALMSIYCTFNENINEPTLANFVFKPGIVRRSKPTGQIGTSVKLYCRALLSLRCVDKNPGLRLWLLTFILQNLYSCFNVLLTNSPYASSLVLFGTCIGITFAGNFI